MIRLHALQAHGFKQLHEIELTFPERCQVLIEGENEAGKSTLFEAAYFALYGKPIANVKLPELISNRLQEAFVQLAFSAGGVQLVVERRLHRTRATQATLSITQADGSPEVIRGVRDVSEEVVRYLHGLSAESLRHSCYVEQKGLHKLSEINKNERMKVLLQILDQGELEAAARHFKAREPHAAELARTQQVVELARAWRAEQAARARRDAAERALWRLQLAMDLDEWARALQNEQEQRERSIVLGERIEALDAHIRQVEAWEEAARTLLALAVARRDLASLDVTVAGLDEQLAHLDKLAKETLPVLDWRHKYVQRARMRLKAGLDAAQRQSEAKQRLAALRDVEAHEAASQPLRTRLAELARNRPGLEEVARQAGERLASARTWHASLAADTERLERLKALSAEMVETEQRRQALAQREQQARTMRQHANQAAEQLSQARLRHAAAGRAQALRAWAEAHQQVQAEQASLQQSVKALAKELDEFQGLRSSAESAHKRAAQRRHWAWAGWAPAAILLAASLVVLVARLPLAVDARILALILASAAAVLAGAGALWWYRLSRRMAAHAAEAARVKALHAERTEERTRSQAQLEVFDQKATALLTVPRARLAELSLAEPDSIEAALALAEATQAEAGDDLPDLDALQGLADESRARAEELERGLDTERAMLNERDRRAQSALAREKLADLAALLSEADALQQGLQARQAAGQPDLAALEAAAREAAEQLEAAQREEAEINGALRTRDAQRDRLLQALGLRALAEVPAARTAAQASLEEATPLRDAALAEVAEALAKLELSPDLEQAETTLVLEKDGLERDIRRLRDELRQQPMLAERRRQQAEAQADKRRQIAEYLDRLQSLVAAGHLNAVPAEGLEEDTARQLRAQAQAAGLAGLKAQANQLRTEQANAEAEARLAGNRATAAQELAHGLLAQLGVEGLVAQSPAEVHQSMPDLPSPDPAECEAQAQAVQDANYAERSSREQREALQATLNLDPDTVDEEAETARLQAMLRQQSVCRLAADVIAHARRSVIERLLPNTRRFASQLLPYLTNGRYRDIDLDEDTFQLKVWDAQFGRMVRRELFSGGAQDQFALALRLGFALAALPENLGAAPAFVFLDEPVASFDRVRREAFVELIRTGLVGQRFEQIFISEPEGIFPDNPFSHYLRLEAGRIVEQSWTS